MIPLQYLKRGESAEVLDVSGEPACVRRMHELGLRPGVTVRMLQPGKTSLIESVCGRLSVRTEGCVEVLVSLASSTTALVGEVA